MRGLVTVANGCSGSGKDLGRWDYARPDLHNLIALARQPTKPTSSVSGSRTRAVWSPA
jgi:hypothetical protein